MCDADCKKVWLLVESFRVLGWARPKSYAGDLVLFVAVGVSRVQSSGGLLDVGQLAAELAVDGDVFL